MEELVPDKPAWRRGLVVVLKTILWPNTLFAVFGAWVLAEIWLYGLNGPPFDKYLEFLIGIPIIAVFFNLLALNKDDHFLLGCTVSLCLILSVFYVLSQKDIYSRHASLPDTSQTGSANRHKANRPEGGAAKEAPKNGTQLIPFRGAKGPAAVRIVNRNSLDAAVKLLGNDSGAQTLLFIYIKAHSETTVRDIENGSYIVRFALGTDWDRQTRKFLSNQGCFQRAKPLLLNYSETGKTSDAPHEIRLHPAGSARIDERVF